MAALELSKRVCEARQATTTIRMASDRDLDLKLQLSASIAAPQLNNRQLSRLFKAGTEWQSTSNTLHGVPRYHKNRNSPSLACSLALNTRQVTQHASCPKYSGRLMYLPTWEGKANRIALGLVSIAMVHSEIL